MIFVGGKKIAVTHVDGEWIADNKADIYPRLAPTCEWDTAAAHAILEGAGGKVLQLNGKDIIYGKENILNPYFIAHGIENKVEC